MICHQGTYHRLASDIENPLNMSHGEEVIWPEGLRNEHRRWKVVLSDTQEEC